MTSRLVMLMAVALLGFAGILTTGPSASAQPMVTSWSEGRAPDLAVVLQGEPMMLRSDVLSVSEALRSNPNTSNFAVVPTAVDTSVIYVHSLQPADGSFLDLVENLVENNSVNSSVSVVGSGVADVRLQNSIEREALLAIGLLALVAGAILALLYSWRVGVGVSVILVVSAVSAILLATLLGPRFNGSVLTTALPAVVACLVVVTVMGYHVTRTALVAGASEDLRSTIRASLGVARELGQPILIVLGQLVFVWLVIGLIFPSSNPISTTVVGVVAGAVIGILFVPLLIQLGGVNFDRPSHRLRSIFREHEMAQTIGIAIVALLVVGTVVGVLNSFGRPSASSLDQRSLDTRSAAITELQANGDLTEAIAMSAPLNIENAEIDRFAVEVSMWPSVKLVQTSSVVAIDGTATDNTAVERDRPFLGLETADSHVVLVVPVRAERSASTQQLVMDLRNQRVLSELTVGAERLNDIDFEARQAWLLASVVFLSCLGGAVAALLLRGNLPVILALATVRLFLLLGIVGIGSSLIAGDSVDEIVLLVLVVSAVLAWFESSYWMYREPGLSGLSAVQLNVSLVQRMRTPMRSSSVGLVSLAAIGFTWMFADASFLRPMGMVLVVVPIVVTAALNVLVPPIFRYASTIESDFGLPAEKSLKFSVIAPAILSFASQPFGRSLPTVASRLRPLVDFRFGKTPSLDVDVQEPKVAEIGSAELAIDDRDETLVASKDDVALGEEVTNRREKSTIGSFGFDDGLDGAGGLAGDGGADNKSSGRSSVVIDGFTDVTIAGEGGFAVVYRAVDAAGKVVAIKVLTAVNDDNERRRFDREKEALETLSDVHNVVELLGSGRTSSGAPYLVLAYFEGGTVARRIRNRVYNWHEAYELGCTLADTLAICHQRGVFHRDLKPSNVLLDDNDQPYLLDFGSTQIVDGRSMSTRSAFTPNYCPPEVLIAGNKGSDGALVDVYGLGVLLWAMVAGRRPFVTEDSGSDEIPALFNRVATQTLDPLVGVPTWFSEIVEKAIEKQPSKRFASIAEMHTALMTRSRSLIPVTGADHSDQKSEQNDLQKDLLPSLVGTGFAALFARRLPDISDLFGDKSVSSERSSKSTGGPKVTTQLTKENGCSLVDQLSEIDWLAEVSQLISADFGLTYSPEKHQVDEVYSPGTEVYNVATKARSDFIELGYQIVGDQPQVLRVEAVNDGALVCLDVTVRHPRYMLLDQDGQQLESCPLELRRSRLWLVETDQGYRISAIVVESSDQDGT